MYWALLCARKTLLEALRCSLVRMDKIPSLWSFSQGAGRQRNNQSIHWWHPLRERRIVCSVWYWTGHSDDQILSERSRQGSAQEVTLMPWVEVEGSSPGTICLIMSDNAWGFVSFAHPTDPRAQLGPWHAVGALEFGLNDRMNGWVIRSGRDCPWHWMNHWSEVEW